MNIFVIVGLLINVAYNMVNRFVVKIPSKIAIPILVIGIACLVIGFVQMGQSGLFCRQ